MKFNDFGRMIPLTHQERVMIEDALMFYIRSREFKLGTNEFELPEEKIKKIKQLSKKIRYYGSPHNTDSKKDGA